MKNPTLNIISALCLLTLSFGGHCHAQTPHNQLKIATVDVQKLFKEYQRTTEEQQKFSEEFARIQKENNERLLKIRGLEDIMVMQKKKTEDPVIAASARQKEAKALQLKLTEARAMDKERREFLGRRTRALELKKQASMQGILEEIRKRIVDHAKKEDFDYVFDKSGLSANQVPFLLYAKDAKDITAALLTQLNKNKASPK